MTVFVSPSYRCVPCGVVVGDLVQWTRKPDGAPMTVTQSRAGECCPYCKTTLEVVPAGVDPYDDPAVLAGVLRRIEFELSGSTVLT